MVDLLVGEFGPFDLDPAADPGNAKAAAYFTDDDGLAQPWRGRVWLNPPYGRTIGDWLRKAAREVDQGDAELVCCLVPARVDIRWYGQAAAAASLVRLLPGRIRFGWPGYEPRCRRRGLTSGAVDVTAWVAIVAPITTLLGGLGGYWLAGRNEEARDVRAAGREAAARRAALAERLEEDRHNFQRDTLLALQDGLFRFYQLRAEGLRLNEEGYKESGQAPLWPQELNDEEYQARAVVERLRVRILDPALRRAVDDFIVLCVDRPTIGQVLSRSKDELAAAVDEQRTRMDEQYLALNELLGEHLRRELDRRGLADLQSAEDVQT